MKGKSLLATLGPGILVAATGVGAGDLATAAFTGSRLGVAVLWAVVVGAGLKLVLNEGLARFQLATGETLLEGLLSRARWPVLVVFAPYFLLWSYFVGAALMSATGVAMNAIAPAFDDPARGKLVFGAAHSALGVALVWLGGFRLFERVMGLCIGLMFAVVCVTAAALSPDPSAIAAGLAVPSIPDADGAGLGWTVALMGGVGGTLTVLCYGYWIRESGRQTLADLRACRIDLAAGYGMTALFGVAMVIIGSHVDIDGRGAGLIVALADALEKPLGPVGRWAFLVGAWGAIFSSLLGVWQAVPYLFADALYRTTGRTPPERLEDSRPYRLYLLALATVPALGLTLSFARAQKLYAIFGAAFMPLLAIALLVVNNRVVGDSARNRWPTNAALAACLAFFAWTAARSLT